MKRQLPPLTALVAFEAAARHLNFKDAGDELSVTPSAISHQIRSLEDWLGVNVFERSTRKLELTDFGKRYATEASPLLDKLEKISSRETQNKTVTVQTTESVATRWLIPNLRDFQTHHPNIEVKIITHNCQGGLRESEVDVGILFVNDKSSTDTKNFATQLFAEEIFPVCSPKMAKEKNLSKLEHLNTLTLNHDDNACITWREWILGTDSPHKTALAKTTDRGHHYNHAHLALQSAELGGGIALSSNVLTMEAIKNGKLVAPLKDKMITGAGYYLAQSPGAMGRDECRRFTDWVTAKCQ